MVLVGTHTQTHTYREREIHKERVILTEQVSVNQYRIMLSSTGLTFLYKLNI